MSFIRHCNKKTSYAMECNAISYQLMRKTIWSKAIADIILSLSLIMRCHSLFEIFELNTLNPLVKNIDVMTCISSSRWAVNATVRPVLAGDVVTPVCLVTRALTLMTPPDVDPASVRPPAPSRAPPSVTSRTRSALVNAT